MISIKSGSQLRGRRINPVLVNCSRQSSVSLDPQVFRYSRCAVHGRDTDKVPTTPPSTASSTASSGVAGTVCRPTTPDTRGTSVSPWRVWSSQKGYSFYSPRRGHGSQECRHLDSLPVAHTSFPHPVRVAPRPSGRSVPRGEESSRYRVRRPLHHPFSSEP